MGRDTRSVPADSRPIGDTGNGPVGRRFDVDLCRMLPAGNISRLRTVRNVALRQRRSKRKRAPAAFSPVGATHIKVARPSRLCPSTLTQASPLCYSMCSRKDCRAVRPERATELVSPPRGSCFVTHHFPTTDVVGYPVSPLQVCLPARRIRPDEILPGAGVHLEIVPPAGLMHLYRTSIGLGQRPLAEHFLGRPGGRHGPLGQQ